MPYYKDISGDLRRHWITFTNGKTGVTTKTYDTSYATELKATTGFRTRPKDDNSVVVSDQSADPYAYFLSSTRRQDYLAALKERGMSDISEPDRGHAFDSYTYTYKHTTTDASWVYHNGTNAGNENRSYGVPLRPPLGSAEFDIPGPFRGSAGNLAIVPNSDILNFAQRAIAKTSPTLAQFSLSAFLGELREGLPKLIPRILSLKGKADIARAAGGDYLNVEFGWKPLLKDLQEIYNILTNASEILAGRPIEGAPVRRTWGLPATTEEFSLTGTGEGYFSLGTTFRANNPLSGNSVFWGTPGNINGGPSGPIGDWRASKVLTRRQWFVGSYITFFPLGFDPSSYEDRLKALIDVRITPSTLWQLAPWSWLVDWALHIGDSIESNRLASDKLIHIHYAYAMEQTTCEVFTDFTVKNYTIGSGDQLRTYRCAPSHNSVTSLTRKRRIRANPYGFTSGGLSALKPNQIAILTALGLSRT